MQTVDSPLPDQLVLLKTATVSRQNASPKHGPIGGKDADQELVSTTLGRLFSNFGNSLRINASCFANLGQVNPRGVTSEH